MTSPAGNVRSREIVEPNAKKSRAVLRAPQVGLIDAQKLPATEMEASRKVVDPAQEASNRLIKRVRVGD